MQLFDFELFVIDFLENPPLGLIFIPRLYVTLLMGDTFSYVLRQSQVIK
jgi:hypothetical protein